jgi:hypothetical protein
MVENPVVFRKGQRPMRGCYLTAWRPPGKRRRPFIIVAAQKSR